MSDNLNIDYGIEQHIHAFAAWAASRAAAVSTGAQFSVETGRVILEGCGAAKFSDPDSLPEPSSFDDAHRLWRRSACQLAKKRGLNFTHGVAAKLINVYHKARFVCAGHHLHPKVFAIHPPVDSQLLINLSRRSFGGDAAQWSLAWSKLDSNAYEKLIKSLRNHLCGKPLWTIEQYWPGFRRDIR